MTAKTGIWAPFSKKQDPLHLALMYVLQHSSIIAACCFNGPLVLISLFLLRMVQMTQIFWLRLLKKRWTKLWTNKKASKAARLRGYSPWHLKTLWKWIAGSLRQIYSACLATSTFPSLGLNSTLFFLNKQGDRSDPRNYRIIAIQDPFLKFFFDSKCTIGAFCGEERHAPSPSIWFHKGQKHSKGNCTSERSGITKVFHEETYVHMWRLSIFAKLLTSSIGRN